MIIPNVFFLPFFWAAVALKHYIVLILLSYTYSQSVRAWVGGGYLCISSLMYSNKLSVYYFFLVLIWEYIFKVIVTVKSCGCCEYIGFGPLVIDYIWNIWFDPPNSSYSNLKVLNRSQSGPNEGQAVSEIYYVVSDLKLLNNWS